MTDYVVDTVAFVRYLQDVLPPRADRVFEDAEAGKSHLYLPEIALAEFVYLALRGRLRALKAEIQVRDVLHNLSASEAFTVSAMPDEAWEIFVGLKIPELHDRLIAAEASARGLSIVSSDTAFDDLRGVSRVW